MKTPDSPRTPPVILAFEASTNQLSVAVHADGKIVAMKTAEAAFGQAASLVPLAVSTLAEAGVDFGMISHVAAGRGPGSFTGIRVCLAAAKGVCLAHDLSGLGISGLEALAFSGAGDQGGGPILCLADTRRGNVYAQFFAADMTPYGDIFEAQIEQLPLLMPADFNHPDYAHDGVRLAGYGRQAAADAFIAAGWLARPIAGRGTKDDLAAVVDAGMIAQLAAHHLAKGIAAPLTPLYLADPRLGPKKKAPAG